VTIDRTRTSSLEASLHALKSILDVLPDQPIDAKANQTVLGMPLHASSGADAVTSHPSLSHP
jgi:hypothetical protein